MNYIRYMQKPDSIISIDSTILDDVEIYEAYVYQYFNTTNGKKYIGYHKGQFDGTYWHSSKNREFINVFAGLNEALLLKIINYGSKEDMMNLEHEMLKEVDAVNNPDYYNGSNAAPAFKTAINPEACQNVLPVIYELEVNLENKEDVNPLPRTQVRYGAESPSHVMEIRQKVKDKGDIAHTDPITIFEKAGVGEFEGQDIIGDGNCTLRAVEPLGNIPKVKTRRVTQEIIQAYGLSFNDIKYLGNLLNKKPFKSKDPTNKDDAVKMLVDEHEENGMVIDSAFARSLLTPLGFTRDQSKAIIKKAKTQADDKTLSKRGAKIAQYNRTTHPENYKKVEEKKEELTTDNSRCVACSSGNVKTLLQNVLNALNTPAAKQRYILYLLIHHSSTENEKNWKDKNHCYVQGTLDNIFSMMKPVQIGRGASKIIRERELVIDYMPHIVSDTEKKNVG